MKIIRAAISNMQMRNTLVFTCLVVIPSIHSPMTTADDYLDALQQEANQLEYLDETRPSNAITTRKKDTNPAIRQAMQSITHFEKYYRKQDSASAAIYFRLKTQERLRIYHRFKSTRNFELARKMTIDIFNQKQ